MNSIYSNFQGFLEKSNFIFAFWSLFIMVIIVFSFAYFKKKELFFFGNKKAPIAKNTNYTENKRQPNYTSNSKINTLNAKDNESYSLWLNNYLEWSYIHCEHAKKINSFLLKSLIDSVNLNHFHKHVKLFYFTVRDLFFEPNYFFAC